MKETDLAKPIADWLRQQGYVVYAEIPCLSRRVDFIGLRNNDIICVELKRSLTTKQPKRARGYTSPVLYQARSCQLITSIVYVAVATNPHTSSIKACEEIGVGILRVCSKSKVVEIITPHKQYEPSIHLREEIKAHCIAIKPSDDAGKPQQVGEGPAQDCYWRIKQYRETHPKATWKDIFKEVPNHYSSQQSMYGAMRIAGCTIAKRKWKADQALQQRR